ncbi:MAG TPA: glycosyltransferase family 39 protein [Bryobacteraceae bacterium]|nr:glycosyltransferase family 39 protein [Bryobacteraceae bacterium]
MPQALQILFGALFTVAVAMALGKLLLRRLGAPLYRQEEHALAFVCGAALLSPIVFAACTLGVARPAFFLGAGVGILAVAFAGGAHRGRGPSLPPLPRFWKWLFGLVYGIYALLYFFNAMAPEFSPDGSAYHLGLVYRYLLHGGFYPIHTNMYANLSQGVELLFLFAFAFGKHSAAALVHCAFLLALPWLILGWARRAGMPEAGVCGALLVFASPVVGIDGVSAYIDVALAAIVFTVFYLLQIWDAERRRGLLVAIGLVAGFAYAAKYTAFVAVPYALGFVLWKSWRKRQPLFAPALIVGAVAAILILPWMIKNMIILGNPFSPFLNTFFPNPYVSIAFEHEYGAWMRSYDLKSYAELPLAVTVRGQLAGVIGPLFLLAPLALLAPRWREGRHLLLAGALFGSTYFGNIGTRFLIWVLPFTALAMAMVFLRVRYLAPALVLVLAVLSWPAVIPRYSIETAWRLTTIPWQAALRIIPEDQFLRKYLADYPAARMIEEVVPAGAPVLMHSPVPTAYTSRDVRVVYQSASGLTLGGMLLSPMLPDALPTWLLTFRFPARQLHKVRVVQTALGQSEKWSIAELRVYNGPLELPRAPEWRLRANPNPWDVQMAFDNSPVTRWSSAESLHPGMSVEVDFGKPRNVDRVLLECSHDQYKIRLRLEGQDEAGKWIPLADEPEQADAPLVEGLRRAATEELKQRGIRYILVWDSDFGADDFRTRPGEWGLGLVGKAPGATLFQIL